MRDRERVVDLVRRARRLRRESNALLVAVMVCNVAYVIASVVRASSALAWSGILVASIAAHVTAWRLRQHGHELELQLRDVVRNAGRVTSRT